MLPKISVWWSQVWRDLRVVRRISALNMRARMAYRIDFLMSIMFGLAWQLSTLLFVYVLFNRFGSGLGTVSAEGVLFIVGLRLLSHGSYVLLFATIHHLPVLIDDGRFDGYLLRPLPILTQVMTSQFNTHAIGDLTAGLLAFGVALHIAVVDWSVGLVVFVAAAVVGGVLLEAALQIIIACLLLRMPASRVLAIWVDELMSTFGNYPLSILAKPVQLAFTFILPMAFVAYFPSLVIFDQVHDHGFIAALAYASPAVGPLLFTIALRFWRWKLRNYHSVGG